MLKTVKLHQKPQYVQLVEIICKYSCISKIFNVHLLFLQYFLMTLEMQEYTRYF